MSDLFLLSRPHMWRIEPFFPKPRGLPRVGDRSSSVGSSR